MSTLEIILSVALGLLVSVNVLVILAVRAFLKGDTFLGGGWK